MKRLIILFLILSLFVGCSGSEKNKIYNSEDVELNIDIAVYEVKDGFLISISYRSDFIDEPKIISKILNKFKISALDVINLSLQTKYSHKSIILVRKTVELENEISEYLKESETNSQKHIEIYQNSALKFEK